MTAATDEVPRHTGGIGVTTNETKVKVVRVYGLPVVDETYNSVLVQIVDPALPTYEFRLSGPDAQRLGHALNIAGGGRP